MGSNTTTSNLDSFPTWALQPRKETGATAFLAKNPQYDGRGVVIAIFDSGVDPGAGGMQVTSDGKPKIIDRIDGSGAGDVDTSTVVETKMVDGVKTVQGLTGRTLKVPNDWKNPSGKWNVGVKNAFDLYPRGLKDDMIARRQEKYWDSGHKRSQAEALKKQEGEVKEDGDNLSLPEKLLKENREAEVEMVGVLDKKFKDTSVGHWLTDLGPVYDCLVWDSGEGMRAAIDTSEVGDLAKGLNLGVFRETREWGKLTEMDQVNVSVNIYSEGSLLEIVSMPSSHGTHVASIAAACFPDMPEKNGLAPGAQIVSVNIGDSRLNSMETGTALARAMSHVMRAEHYKVDLINMSYGEHSHWSTAGRVGDLMSEVINKHGVTWVASAGNDGPALCTVGTPPDIITNAVIGVGAYVSPEMMTAMYSTREKMPGTPYTWSSRGPTIDGERGVCVCAPGGAITSVPHFSMKGTQLMNGTSMASPHVCGALALTMSGMRAQGMAWSPYSVKRAVENTATPLKDMCQFGQGNGLLNVEGVFEHLVQNQEKMERDVRFKLICGLGSAKGIHLRGKSALKVKEIPVQIEPIFLDHDNRPAKDKHEFNMELVFSCSASWVTHPTHLNCHLTNRMILLRVDPTGLAPGAHCAYVTAHDATNPGRGKLFEVAVNVVRTEQLEMVPRPKVVHRETFQPGSIKRHFLEVPSGATWATFSAANLTKDTPGKFVLHTVQLLPKLVVRTLEHHKMFNLAENGEWQHTIPVRGGPGQVVEFCLSKWWANIGTVDCQYSITFHGVRPSNPSMVMHGGEGIYRLDLDSENHSEEAQPEVKLKNSVQVVRPAEGKVVSLGCGTRDILPVGRHMYELQLQYSFSLPKTAETILNLAMLSDVLYESELESQLWMVYDTNKRLLGSGDAYPSKWSLKLEKGDYTVRVSVRHEKRELVDKFMDTPLLVSSRLSSPISLDVYSSQSQAQVSGKKGSSMTVYPGRSTPVYIAPLATDKHSKGATLGQYLQGTATFAKDEAGKKADVYTFKYMLPDGGKKKDKGKDKEKEKKKDDMAAYEEAIRDCKVSWLAKLGYQTKEGQELYKDLCATGTNLTSVQSARLSNILSTEGERDWDAVLEQADKVVMSVDQQQLLAWLGMKSDARDNAVEVKKEMEKSKLQLVEAFAAKGEAMLEKGENDGEKLLGLYTDIVKFTDQNDAKVFSFMWKLFRQQGMLAKALKLSVKQLEDKQTKENEKVVVELLAALGWDHVVRFIELGQPARYPSDYQPF
jgi:tripeptidyl-peptidase-2